MERLVCRLGKSDIDRSSMANSHISPVLYMALLTQNMYKRFVCARGQSVLVHAPGRVKVLRFEADGQSCEVRGFAWEDGRRSQCLFAGYSTVCPRPPASVLACRYLEGPGIHYSTWPSSIRGLALFCFRIQGKHASRALHGYSTSSCTTLLGGCEAPPPPVLSPGPGTRLRASLAGTRRCSPGGGSALSVAGAYMFSIIVGFQIFRRGMRGKAAWGASEWSHQRDE